MTVGILIYMTTHPRAALCTRAEQSKDVTFCRNDVARAETEAREAVSRADAARQHLIETERGIAAAIARSNHESHGEGKRGRKERNMISKRCLGCVM